jgi:hypothetical protein
MRRKALLLSVALITTIACSSRIQNDWPSPTGSYSVRFDVNVDKRSEKFDEQGSIEFKKGNEIVYLDRWTLEGSDKNFVSSFPAIEWIEPTILRMGVDSEDIKGNDWLSVINQTDENLKLVRVNTGDHTSERFAIFDLVTGTTARFRVYHMKRLTPGETFRLATPVASFTAIGDSGKEYSGQINIAGGLVNAGKVPPEVSYQMSILPCHDKAIVDLTSGCSPD